MNPRRDSITDGRTGREIPVNPDVPRDFLTFYITWMVATMGYERAADYFGIPLEDR